MLKAVKGFRLDWSCAPTKQDRMQYAVGQIFEHSGSVRLCQEGLHACENPPDVFFYYPPAKSRYAFVEMSGEISKDGSGDSNVAAKRLKVVREISHEELTREAIAFVKAKVDNAEPASRHVISNPREVAGSTADRRAVGAIAHCSVAASTGRFAVCYTGGDDSVAAVTGEKAIAAAKGLQVAAVATNPIASVSADGYQCAAVATGSRSAACAAGISSAAVSTGSDSHSVASGLYGVATASNSNSDAHAAGRCSVSIVSAERSRASASDPTSVAVATARDSVVLGVEGSALVAVERGIDDTILSVAVGIVGQRGIKPHTWYECKKGRLVERT